MLIFMINKYHNSLKTIREDEENTSFASLGNDVFLAKLIEISKGFDFILVLHF